MERFIAGSIVAMAPFEGLAERRKQLDIILGQVQQRQQKWRERW